MPFSGILGELLLGEGVLGNVGQGAAPPTGPEFRYEGQFTGEVTPSPVFAYEGQFTGEYDGEIIEPSGTFARLAHQHAEIAATRTPAARLAHQHAEIAVPNVVFEYSGQFEGTFKTQEEGVFAYDGRFDGSFNGFTPPAAVAYEYQGQFTGTFRGSSAPPTTGEFEYNGQFEGYFTPIGPPVFEECISGDGAPGSGGGSGVQRNYVF
jgi:hypothetical protein